MEAVASDIALMRRSEAAIAELIEARAAALTAGMAKEYADYTRRVGELQGLREALEQMKAIADRMMGKTPEGER